MKECFKCLVEKPLDDFYKHPKMADGHLNKCKDCTKNDTKSNYNSKKDYYKEYDKKRQKQDINRILTHRYRGIVQRATGKATRAYKVQGKEILTYEEYVAWCNDTWNDFTEVYNQWAKSGFKRNLTPSIDRIDSNGSYTVDNIQWLSLTENCRKR